MQPLFLFKLQRKTQFFMKRGNDMKSMRSLPFRFASSFLGAFALCMTVASLIMAKREFYEVTINQILFHLQLVGDNVVTMPEAFIDVFSGMYAMP